MSEEEIHAIIEGALGPYLVPGTTYPHPLPAEIAPWHCYTIDGGHSVAVVLRSQVRPGPGVDLAEFLAPAPVKAVLRAGYEVRDGWVWCDLPYSREFGLITEPGDHEF